jgi:hypothetical protein
MTFGLGRGGSPFAELRRDGENVWTVIMLELRRWRLTLGILEVREGPLDQLENIRRGFTLVVVSTKMDILYLYDLLL